MPTDLLRPIRILWLALALTPLSAGATFADGLKGQDAFNALAAGKNAGLPVQLDVVIQGTWNYGQNPYKLYYYAQVISFVQNNVSFTSDVSLFDISSQPGATGIPTSLPTSKDPHNAIRLVITATGDVRALLLVDGNPYLGRQPQSLQLNEGVYIGESASPLSVLVSLYNISSVAK